MELEILEVNKSILPYECSIVLGGELFSLHFNHNATADLFTVDLYKDETLICAGEPIVYGIPLWADVYREGVYPNVLIVPLDPSEESNAVTYDNLGNTVLLIVASREGEADG